MTSPSRYLLFVAVLVSLCSSYVTADTYSTVLRFQTEALATFNAALAAFDNWQTAVKPVLDAWVTGNPVTVTTGIAEVKSAGAGTLVSWVLFAVSVWPKRKGADA